MRSVPRIRQKPGLSRSWSAPIRLWPSRIRRAQVDLEAVQEMLNGSLTGPGGVMVRQVIYDEESS
jgi:hypothetical protein